MYIYMCIYISNQARSRHISQEKEPYKRAYIVQKRLIIVSLAECVDSRLVNTYVCILNIDMYIYMYMYVCICMYACLSECLESRLCVNQSEN